MACDQPNLSKRSTPEFRSLDGLGPLQPITATLLPSPPLLVSDNPETVTPDEPEQGVLWRQILKGTGALACRVFLWHLNESGLSRKLGLTLENRGTAGITVLSMRRQSEVVTGSAKFLRLGQCIAEAVLADTLDAKTPQDPAIPPGETGLLEAFPWGKHGLCGAQYELRLGSSDAGTPLDGALRVVFGAPGSDLRSFQGPPLAPNGPHARGGWEGSELAVTAGYRIAGDGTAPRVHYRLAEGQSGSADFLFRSDNTTEQPAPYPTAHNRANFGVIYRDFRLTVTNESPEDRDLEFFLNPRGGIFAGAVRTSTALSQVHGIPRLDPWDESVSLGVIRCPGESTLEETIELMVAGAANTPVALVVQPTGG